MPRPSPSRRDFLRAASFAAATPLLARCTSAVDRALVTFEPPQRLTTDVTRLADGSFARTFAGVAAPQNLELFDEDTGRRQRLHDLFPRAHCPFAIDTTRELGPGGFGLGSIDRTLGGVLPGADVWPLNMVPFGVAIDGVILDPSGPWYDGGPADPKNPFDRACSGWEYDPIFATVAELVGVPAEVRGHCQPGPGEVLGSAGLFHYHGAPRVMLANLRNALTDDERRAPLIVGYAGDGYWILDAVIPAEATASGKRRHLFSGYVLRGGARGAVPHTNPALVAPGTYDGTYVEDWQFDPVAKQAQIEAELRDTGEYLGLTAADLDAGVADFAVLDARNGLVTDELSLPDAPPGAYVYVMTPDWPEIPRWFAFEPSPSFLGIIPFASPGPMGPPGRQQLYQACSADLADVHQWNGRAPY